MSTLFDPAKIEREITTLQRSLSPSETRTMLFNLLIFSRREDENDVEKALGYLLGKRPARIIHIRNSENATSDIHVSARCFPDRENKGVCFQEIVIDNGADGTGSAVGSWSPLLLRDIPVYLWWLDRLQPVPELLHRAREHVDKIIVDTQKSDSFGESVCGIYKGFISGTLRQDFPVSDVSWRKLSNVRKTTAKLFDPEHMRPLLSFIRHVQLRGMNAAAALLYIFWLADRLKWRKTGENSFIDAEGNTVTWMHRDPASIRRGAEISFALSTGDEVRMKIEPSGYAELTVPLEKPSIVSMAIPSYGEILLEELDYQYHDYLFAEVAGTLCRDD